MKTSEVLDAAADLLEVRGWNGRAKLPAGENAWFPEPGSTHPVCVEGAMRSVGGFAYRGARQAMIAYLTDLHPDLINPVLGYVAPWVWNDRRAESAEEVVEALRAAALIEAAKETAVVIVTPQPEAVSA